MISKVIDILQSDDFYGGGEHIEIAKGKHEYITTWKGFKRKIKRQWLKKSK